MNIELTCEKSSEILDILNKNTYYSSSIVNCVLLLKKLNIKDFELKYNGEIITLEDNKNIYTGEIIKYVDGKLVEYSNPALEYKEKKLVPRKNNTGNYEVQEFLRKKELLEKTDDIVVYKFDSLLVGTYRLFCNSNPDFSNKNTRDRIQILGYFLTFVLSPTSYSTYFTRFNNEMPYNELIEYEMDKLEVLNNEELNNLVISDKTKNSIISLMTKLNNEYKNCTLLDLIKLYHDYYNNPDADKKCEKFVKCIKNSN